MNQQTNSGSSDSNNGNSSSNSGAVAVVTETTTTTTTTTTKRQEGQQHEQTEQQAIEVEEWKQLLKEVGISSTSSLFSSQLQQSISNKTIRTDTSTSCSTIWQNPIISLCCGTVLLGNIALLCSLPPVLRGRGAPYLPIVERNMISMFQQLRNDPTFIMMKQQRQQQLHHHRHIHPNLNCATNTAVVPVGENWDHSLHSSISSTNDSDRSHQSTAPRTGTTSNFNNNNNHNIKNYDSIFTKSNEVRFVDLGSGDGRIVFYAAYQTQNIFTHCIGYEINPFLFLYSIIRQQCNQLYNHIVSIFSTTDSTSVAANDNISSSTTTNPRATTTKVQFYLQDLWSVDLSNVHVVAVYGLGPIMKELGKKLQKELPNGSYILSNVFPFPGWKPIRYNVNNNNHIHNSTANTTTTNTFIYRTPDCWEHLSEEEEEQQHS